MRLLILCALILLSAATINAQSKIRQKRTMQVERPITSFTDYVDNKPVHITVYDKGEIIYDIAIINVSRTMSMINDKLQYVATYTGKDKLRNVVLTGYSDVNNRTRNGRDSFNFIWVDVIPDIKVTKL
jgi:hypothetical protein